MPKDFDMCREHGGRIVTKKMAGGKFMHICFDKNGNSHAGEVKMKKEMKKHAKKKG